MDTDELIAELFPVVIGQTPAGNDMIRVTLTLPNATTDRSAGAALAHRARTHARPLGKRVARLTLGAHVNHKPGKTQWQAVYVLREA